ncbi:hypothetical protein GOP56_11140 [Brevibacillus sp. 7WMA2]|uniref:hypothetical protein n=1 Tax=Brevibacillus sp. 7WMA2 TaxID=2683193 RepID=UPI0013A72288|nr:hypothetical protein [Brevibacillus sp. 7WMA2]QIC06117.1 hypothetical protein GOP56_11140 [Brevibacillus sp. 7WMA2]
MSSNGRFMDVTTGEILDVVESGHFHNGTTEPQKVLVDVSPGQRVRSYRPKKFDRTHDFTMVFHANNRDLVRNKRLTDDEKSLLFSILIFLDYDQYVKDEQSFYFNVNRVADLMGWSRQRAARVLDGLCSRDKRLLGCTKIGREKYYMLNPHFIYRGDTSVLATAVKLFEQAAVDNDEEESA